MYTTTTGDPRDLARRAALAQKKRQAKANQRMAAARVGLARIAAVTTPKVGA